MDDSGSISSLFRLEALSPDLKMYIPFVVAGACSLVVPFCIWVLSQFFGSIELKKSEPETPPGDSIYRKKEQLLRGSAFKMGRRYNSRFFVGSIIAHLLVGMVFVLVPLVYRLGFPMPERGDRFKVLFLIVVLAALVLLSLLYGADKGDLMMLKTFRGDDPGDGKRKGFL